jgi:predicted dehydrogenase
VLDGAIIGTGNIALSGHLPAYLEDEVLKREVSISSVADVSPSNREKVKRLLPSVRVYSSAQDLFDHERPDFVDICSPPHSHRELVERAAEQGCHIVCEKPLATTVEDGRSIKRAIQKMNVVFVPCHQYRYSLVWRSAKDVIEKGELGDLYLAQFNIFRTKADAGSPEWFSDWRVDPKISGGGILVDTGSHYLYLLSYLFGKPRQLTARTATLRHRDYAVEDTAMITAEYETFIAQVNLTWAADRRENRNSIVGAKGMLLTGGDKIRLSLNGAEKELPGEDISDKRTYVRWYAELLKEFLHRVKTRNSSTDLLDEALDVLVWIDCCYQSAAKGMTIPLP